MFLLIFALVTSLYGLQAESVGYSAVLCCALALVYGAIDFISYTHRRRKIESIMYSLTEVYEQLPAPRGGMERDYQMLVSALQGENERLSHESDRLARSMTDYYTMWVHQIKTPISALRLLMQSGGNETAMFAELIKIEQYVEMVLLYTRLESHSSDYVLKPYPLDSIIRQAVRKFSRLFILKDIAINYQGTDAVVLTDEKWLLFCVEQLLSNAIKYTEKGGIFIDVRPDCALVIRDTGIGIAESDVPRIFDKGFTGYNGRKDQFSSGLGLYLCHRILTNLSHNISVESSTGGTAVTIDLSRPDIYAYES